MTDLRTEIEQVLDGITPGEWRLKDGVICGKAFDGSWRYIVDRVRGGNPQQQQANERLLLNAPRLLRAALARLQELEQDIMQHKSFRVLREKTLWKHRAETLEAKVTSLEAQLSALESRRGEIREAFRAGFDAHSENAEPGTWKFTDGIASDLEPQAFAAWEALLTDPSEGEQG